MPMFDGEAARIDVIVVNFNFGLYLRRCLASLFESDTPINVIVVDNASGDESINLARQLDSGEHQVEFILNKTNLGFSAAVNKGAALGQAENILLLNPDSEVHPHTLSKLVAILESKPNAGIVGALVFNEDGTEQRGCRRRQPSLKRSMVTAFRQDHRYEGVNMSHLPMPSEPIAVDAVSGAALMVRRQCYDEVGGLDEGYFLHVEDLDLCRKVTDSGKQVLFAPTVSVFHHQGVSSRRVPVRTEWHKHRGMLRYYGKFQRSKESLVANGLYTLLVLTNLFVTLFRKTIGLLKFNLASYDADEPLELVHLSQKKLTLLTGASSDLGAAVIKAFTVQKEMGPEAQQLIAVTRGKLPPQRLKNEIWLHWSFFEKAPIDDFGHIKQLVLASPIWSASQLSHVANRFGGLQRLVAISSSSIEGKAKTADVTEQAVVKALQDGEHDLFNWAAQAGVSATILRPSMVYGGKQNKNIRFIAKVLRYFRVFPLVANGSAKRQPVHVDDLAAACLALLSQQQSALHTYNLAGGEVVSYRQMVEAIFKAEKISPRFISLSETRLRSLVSLINKLPGLGFLKAEMITRMNRDLVYDNSTAKEDFGYQPGPFRP